MKAGKEVKCIAGLFWLMAIWLHLSVAQAAVSSDYAQAELDYLANLACITAYNDAVGLDARAQMRQNGYKIDSVAESIDQVNIKYQLISYSDFKAAGRIYMLAIAGTEDRSDVRIDMDTKQVYFAGTTPAEFAANAAIGDVGGLPTVHRGFDRYVQKAFFTPDKDGEIVGEQIAARLKAEPDSRLYLVGHSLGGAAAVIAAARLIDMGVSPMQLGIISFGAPEIGNKLFADIYGPRLQVRRIAMQGDLVKYSLNTLFGDYCHVGEEVKWQRDKTARGINHSIYVYFDRALRNYYAAQISSGVELPPNSATPVLCVAPLSLTLPEELEDDRAYIVRSVGITLQNGWHNRCWLAASEEDVARAVQLGAKYILRQSAEVTRVRDKRFETYNVQMTAGLYDAVSGTLLAYCQLSGSTQELSPLLLSIYQTVQLDREIKEQLNHRQKGAEMNETDRANL